MCEKCKIIRRGGAVLVICQNPVTSSVRGDERLDGAHSGNQHPPQQEGRDQAHVRVRVGRSTSNQVLEQAGVDPDTYVKDLTEDEVRKLRERVDDLLVEGDLRREQSQNVKRLMEIGSYKGLRHGPAGERPEDEDERTPQGPEARLLGRRRRR